MLALISARRVGADSEGRLLLEFLQVTTLTREPGVFGLPGLFERGSGRRGG